MKIRENRKQKTENRRKCAMHANFAAECDGLLIRDSRFCFLFSDFCFLPTGEPLAEK